MLEKIMVKIDEVWGEKVGGSVSNDSSTSTIGTFTLDDRVRH